jgi:hypothetical protein
MKDYVLRPFIPAPQYPGDHPLATAVPAPVCRCSEDQRRGPVGGVCGNCCGGILRPGERPISYEYPG